MIKYLLLTKQLQILKETKELCHHLPKQTSPQRSPIYSLITILLKVENESCRLFSWRQYRVSPQKDPEGRAVEDELARRETLIVKLTPWTETSHFLWLLLYYFPPSPFILPLLGKEANIKVEWKSNG